MTLTAPGGWNVELVTRSDVAPAGNTTRSARNPRGGTGTQWRVTHHGFYSGYAATNAELAILLGPAYSHLKEL